MYSIKNKIQPSNVVKYWLLGAIAWFVFWVAITQAGLLSAMSVWYINDTYNHCFFILPGALYMFWQQRGALCAQAPQFSIVGGLGVLSLLMMYALGQAAYIDIFQHIAIFAMIPAVVLMMFGWRIVRKIVFPIAFVLFSIPVGEELIPIFQDITAAISMYILNLANIPAYREGLYISVPNGHFVVAEACSGVRFFIACVVLGSVYAYLNFISRWRIALFAVFSVVLPIIANGIRAFGIIYVGHTSDMQHAVDADHLVYGWVFFLIVVLILVGVGQLFSDGHRVWKNTITTISASWYERWNRRSLAAAFAPLVAMGIIAYVVENQSQGDRFELPAATLANVSAGEAGMYDWAPRFNYADSYRVSYDSSAGAKVYQAVYELNIKGRELVSWENRIYDPKLWSLQGQYNQRIEQGFKQDFNITVLDLTSVNGRERLVAYWYVLPNKMSSNGNFIKLQQAVNTLLLKPSGGAIVAVSVEYRGENTKAREQLAVFLERQENHLFETQTASSVSASN
ncbi:exosortase A [Teredinibacter purpureus]|uniref:exosortase A n=1 Tax=Teredinibacter purpureus TaxID=2731756 RepID=UPI0005F7E0D3|nr:EpsI domain-containing exosortase [Teredinibacter purpureus]